MIMTTIMDPGRLAARLADSAPSRRTTPTPTPRSPAARPRGEDPRNGGSRVERFRGLHPFYPGEKQQLKP